MERWEDNRMDEKIKEMVDELYEDDFLQKYWINR